MKKIAFNKTLTFREHFPNKHAVLSHHQEQTNEKKYREVVEMADVAVNEKEVFEFTYSAKQQDEVEKIRAKYLPKQESKMEQLRKLDKSAEQRGTITGIVVGVIGSLIMGGGMSLAMTDLSAVLGMDSIMAMVAGIVIGLIGMVVAGVAYPLYVGITKKQRAKIADQVLKLSEEISL